MILRNANRERRPKRRGAAIVEAAVVLGVFLTLLLGCLDLALAVLRNNALAEGARRLARTAIVRGENSSSLHTSWGPATYRGTANENTDYATAIRDALIVVNRADVQFQLEWPDGGNAAGQRVKTMLTSKYRPILTSLFGVTPYSLQATSVMRIEH